MTASLNPIATGHIPFFVTPPGQTDVLYYVTLAIVIGSIILAGVVFLTIHSLPERMAHKSQKILFDLIALLCLLALFTHEHLFWFIAIVLAFIEVPDFLTPVNRIAHSIAHIAGHRDTEAKAEAKMEETVEASTEAAPHTSSEAKPAGQASKKGKGVHA